MLLLPRALSDSALVDSTRQVYTTPTYHDKIESDDEESLPHLAGPDSDSEPNQDSDREDSICSEVSNGLNIKGFWGDSKQPVQRSTDDQNGPTHGYSCQDDDHITMGQKAGPTSVAILLQGTCHPINTRSAQQPEHSHTKAKR